MQWMIVNDAAGRVRYLGPTQVLGWAVIVALLCATLGAGMYHAVLRLGVLYPETAVGALVHQLVGEDWQRVLQEQVDVLAREVGTLQVRVLQMESLGQRLESQAGLPALQDRLGVGGIWVPGPALSVASMHSLLDSLRERADTGTQKLADIDGQWNVMQHIPLPTQHPVEQAVVSSPFGWRIDPFTGRSAMHQGMDFRGAVGDPIFAAAGGVIVARAHHPEYGHMVDIDHGEGIHTRYAHASAVFVQQGDLVRRGQKIAAVGNTGRSTGPHLHFEVLVDGAAQDPERFLAQGGAALQTAVASIGAPK
ncbi:M23 family metallopeptidase [Candidatus Symbiobacter mobilis]|uniref:Membrane protease subunit n=1 Tax=Candidatus Symbiobacter mobilis CR TaxID=946483 RepID=U5N986_9BURK|nr:M23 family metallopeptidase [Candidatus Symbiobacter mobilis]AGX88126.1 membrane protease subunit [Candidatus Symbiobacter mobilis CR]